MLIPNTLVDRIPQQLDRTFDSELTRLTAQTTKVVLLQPELTWIIHGILGIAHHVLAGDQTPQHLIDLIEKDPSHTHTFLSKPTFMDAANWRRLQPAALPEYNPDHITVQPNGRILYTPDDATFLNVVPPSLRERLTTWQHKHMLHASHTRVYNALKHSYHWHTMQAEIKRIV